MRSHEDKERFLQELSDIPLVSVVCKRIGISKATIYRWKDKDKKFEKRLGVALKQGRGGINDLAEGQVVTLIKKGDFRASKFWLENNNSRYIKPRPKIDHHYQGVTNIRYEIVQTDEEKMKAAEAAQSAAPDPQLP